jgi:hypothetical protein
VFFVPRLKSPMPLAELISLSGTDWTAPGALAEVARKPALRTPSRWGERPERLQIAALTQELAVPAVQCIDLEDRSFTSAISSECCDRLVLCPGSSMLPLGRRGTVLVRQ